MAVPWRSRGDSAPRPQAAQLVSLLPCCLAALLPSSSNRTVGCRSAEPSLPLPSLHPAVRQFAALCTRNADNQADDVDAFDPSPLTTVASSYRM